MACGNGSDRTQHPEELFGPDWAEWVPPTEAERPSAGEAQVQPWLSRG